MISTSRNDGPESDSSASRRARALMTFFALIGFEEVVKAVSESRSSADRWIRSIFYIPYKILKSQK
jgi:hypothetical protein